MDDIVVLSKIVHDHLVHLLLVLRLLQIAAVTLKLKITLSFAEIINYLSHVIRPGRLELAETTTKDIRELQEPATQTEMRYILGIFNVFPQFVPNVSRLVTPHKKKLWEAQPKSFHELRIQERQLVDDLNETVTNPPILAFLWATDDYILDTDAGDT